ncbi:hypothetical protein [Pseudomaricurvus sp.]|uniref:hypothetical protein n=1 Tax=Pseudomaricurvus sp. TaxID=2004510 RepID=UPI003F6B091A
MYFFKALYIRAYFLTALVMTFWVLSQLGQGHWLWVAPLLTWTPMWLHNLWRLHINNSWYQDERERLAMGLALLGVAVMLIGGQRGPVLWWTLAGLFGLLLYVFLVSKMTRGVRESEGDRDLLPTLDFSRRVADDHAKTELVSAQKSGARWMLFFHAPSCPYSRMAMRELMGILEQHPEIKPEQVVVVFADALPDWATKFSKAGGQCWVDADGESSRTLGLWLRGGNALLDGGHNALRPALAALDSNGQVVFWDVANNFRLPPSLEQHWERLQRYL